MIDILNWDSKFFGFNVGRINLLSEPDWNQFDLELSHELGDYRLIYLITADKIKVPETILINNNGIFINQKILYQKEPAKLNDNFPIYICDYKSNSLTSELINLAVVSGTFSRFRIDKNFAPGTFEKMYYLWIKNSVERKIADRIFVSDHREKITGMVTYKNSNISCKVGLLAVDVSERGKETGIHLIKKVEEQAVKKGLSQLQVPTQSNNVYACLFYEKLGFKRLEISNIYHFWIK